MRFGTPKEPCDTRTEVIGNRLVGIDVFADGSESCLRSNLGEYKSPEHALAYKLLMDRHDFLILASEGKITDEVVEKIVAGIRQLQQKGGLEDGIHPQQHRMEADPVPAQVVLPAE